MAFLHPVADQRLLGILRCSFSLLSLGTFGLSFSDELLLLLLNLVCEFALSMDVVIREGVHWGNGPDSVTAFGSDLRGTKESIIRDLGSRGLRRR